jgi:hypothetical protein
MKVAVEEQLRCLLSEDLGEGREAMLEGRTPQRVIGRDSFTAH